MNGPNCKETKTQTCLEIAKPTWCGRKKCTFINNHVEDEGQDGDECMVDKPKEIAMISMDLWSAG